MAEESILFSDISATPANFTLRGGVYSFRVIGTISTSVALQAVGPDGSTLVGCKNLAGTAASLAANGSVDSLWLPPGQYQLTITSATGVYAVIAKVPTV